MAITQETQNELQNEQNESLSEETQESPKTPSHTEQSEVSTQEAITDSQANEATAESRDQVSQIDNETHSNEQDSESTQTNNTPFISDEEVAKADEPTTEDEPLSDEEKLTLEINKAITSDEWQKQVKLSLVAIKECYSNLESIHNFYNTSIQTLRETKEAHANALQEAYTLNNNMQTSISNALENFDFLLQESQNYTNEAKRAEQSATSQALDITTKANTIISQGQDLIKRSAIVEKALKEFEKLESLIIKSQELKFDLASALENHKRELENQKENSETEIIAKFNEVSTQLESEFNTHTTNLQTQFNDIKANLDKAHAKTLDLETLLQEYINNSKAEFENHRAHLAEQKDLADRALNLLKKQTKENKDAQELAHDEAIQHIKTTADLNSAKFNGLNNFLSFIDSEGKSKLDFSYLKYTYGNNNKEILEKEQAILLESEKLKPLAEALAEARKTPPRIYKKRNIWGQSYGSFEDYSYHNYVVSVASAPYNKQNNIVLNLKKELEALKNKSTYCESNETLHRGQYEIILGNQFFIKKLNPQETFTYNYIALKLTNTTWNKLTLKIDMLLGGAFWASKDKTITKQSVELLDNSDGERWEAKIQEWLTKAPELAELPKELNYISGKTSDTLTNTKTSSATNTSTKKPFLYDRNILLFDYKKAGETTENQQDFIFTIKSKDSMYLLISAVALGETSQTLWGELSQRFSLQLLGEEVGEAPKQEIITVDSDEEFEKLRQEKEKITQGENVEIADGPTAESSDQVSQQNQTNGV